MVINVINDESFADNVFLRYPPVGLLGTRRDSDPGKAARGPRHHKKGRRGALCRVAGVRLGLPVLLSTLDHAHSIANYS